MADAPQAATQAQLRAAELIDSLWNDPDIGAKIQAKAKEKFPDVRTSDEGLIPHLEPLKKQNEALQKRLDEMEAERKTEREAAAKEREEAEKKTYEQRIAAARDAYNLTEEGFDKMIARMKETGNYQDPDAAAAWVASKNPPPPPPGPTFGPQSLNLYGSEKADDRYKSLHRDPQRYMDEELTEFVRDPDKYVRETLGQAA